MVDPLFLGVRSKLAFSGDESPGTKLPKGQEKSLGGLQDRLLITPLIHRALREWNAKARMVYTADNLMSCMIAERKILSSDFFSCPQKKESQNEGWLGLI
jgi:hypothetical protein